MVAFYGMGEGRGVIWHNLRVSLLQTFHTILLAGPGEPVNTAKAAYT